MMSIEDDNNLIENMLLHANPNPERTGCPSDEELNAMAMLRVGADDPRFIHVSECSECFAELRALQKANNIGAAAMRTTPWAWWAAAAVVFVIGGSAWYFLPARSVPAPPLLAKSNVSLPSTILDLRPFAVSRSEEVSKGPVSLVVDRRLQKVVLLLPVASAEGLYALKLLDVNLSPLISSNAPATLLNGVTSIPAELDFTTVAQGRYTLAIKRDPEDWRYFPLEVH